MFYKRTFSLNRGRALIYLDLEWYLVAENVLIRGDFLPLKELIGVEDKPEIAEDGFYVEGIFENLNYDDIKEYVYSFTNQDLNSYAYNTYIEDLETIILKNKESEDGTIDCVLDYTTHTKIFKTEDNEHLIFFDINNIPIKEKHEKFLNAGKLFLDLNQQPVIEFSAKDGFFEYSVYIKSVKTRNLDNL